MIFTLEMYLSTTEKIMVKILFTVEMYLSVGYNI